MRAEVRPLFHHGKALSLEMRDKEPPRRGKLAVIEARVHAFGRAVICANLRSATDGTETPLLPELTDAQLIWLDDKRMRLRGTEQVDGALYGQTWDIRVL